MNQFLMITMFLAGSLVAAFAEAKPNPQISQFDAKDQKAQVAAITQIILAHENQTAAALDLPSADAKLCKLTEVGDIYSFAVLVCAADYVDNRWNGRVEVIFAVDGKSTATRILHLKFDGNY